MDAAHLLPTEIWELILSFTSRNAKVYKSLLECCKLFNKLGWKIFDFSINNHAAFRYAAKFGKTKFFAKLLAKLKVIPNLNPPLCQLAASCGNAEALKFFLQNDIKVSERTKQISLRIAIEGKHSEAVNVLVAEPGVRVDSFCLKIASKQNDFETLRVLIRSKKGNKDIVQEIFSRLCEIGEFSLLKEILEIYQLDTSAYHNAAIRRAATGGHNHIVNFLWNQSIKNRPDCIRRLFSIALLKKNLELIKKIFDSPEFDFKDANIDTLIKIVQLGDTSICRRYFSHMKMGDSKEKITELIRKSVNADEPFILEYLAYLPESDFIPFTAGLILAKKRKKLFELFLKGIGKKQWTYDLNETMELLEGEGYERLLEILRIINKTV